MALFGTKKDKLAEEIIEQYRKGISHLRANGVLDNYRLYERFYQGDQWPAPTPATKTFPRPVANKVWETVGQLSAAVTADNPTAMFAPREGAPLEPMGIENYDPQVAGLLTKMGQFEAERLEIPMLLDEGAVTAGNLGTAVWHFFWDNSQIGGSAERQTLWIGAIGAIEIDPANFIEGDPKEYDLQKQPYIIVAERLSHAEASRKVGIFNSALAKRLKPDNERQTETYAQSDVEQGDYNTLIHKWWKSYDEFGRVTALHYALVTMTGEVAEHKDSLYESPDGRPFPRYPFVAFRWEKKRKSFRGMGVTQQVIPNQKERNRLKAMLLLAAYNTAAPKIIYKEGAINTDKWTDVPGQFIKDSSPLGQKGVDYLDPPQMPAYPAAEIRAMDEETARTTGASEAMAGVAPSAELNASAILALQQAAGIRVNRVKRRLYAALREMYHLLFAFWTHLYTEERLIRIVGDDNQEAFMWFRGIDFADMEFDVKVIAGPGSMYSQALQTATLDKLLQGGAIDVAEYLEMLPNEVFPHKGKVLERLRGRVLMPGQNISTQPQSLNSVVKNQMRSMGGESLAGQAQAPGMGSLQD